MTTASVPPLRPVARGARPSIGADLGALNDPDPKVRAEASIRVGRLKDERAVSPLVRTLQEDTSPAVREAAARGLGLIASPSSLPALQTAAQADDDRDVRRSASFAAEIIRANLRR
jgi:HEAT repeat protein